MIRRTLFALRATHCNTRDMQVSYPTFTLFQSGRLPICKQSVGVNLISFRVSYILILVYNQISVVSKLNTVYEQGNTNGGHCPEAESPDSPCRLALSLFLSVLTNLLQPNCLNAMEEYFECQVRCQWGPFLKAFGMDRSCCYPIDLLICQTSPCKCFETSTCSCDSVLQSWQNWDGFD